MKNIYMNAYDRNSYIIDDDILSQDKLHFDYDKPFFMICNVPIINKTMFELNITDYYEIEEIKHIPLYVGVSSSVSNGIMNNSYCMGSLFYTMTNNRPRYEIRANFNATLEDDLTYVYGDKYDRNSKTSPVGSRAPGIFDTIGVAVDTDVNIISIYVNYTLDKSKIRYNKPLYKFTPPFDMKTVKNLRFCIYSDIFYKKVSYIEETIDDQIKKMNDKSKHISGVINFGKSPLSNPVPGYTSLYEEFFNKNFYNNIIDLDIGSKEDPCEVEIAWDKFKYIDSDVVSEVDIDNKLETNAEDIKLISSSTNVDINHNFIFNIKEDNDIVPISDYGDTNSYVAGSNIFINYPIPKDDKIYIEFVVREAVLKRNTAGIPISFGISNMDPKITQMDVFNITNPNSILYKSIRINLYRGSPFIESGINNSSGYYQYHIINNSSQNLNSNSLLVLDNIESTVTPEEGIIIGIAMDLGNNNITIYANGWLFAKLHFPTDKTKFPFTFDLKRKINSIMEYSYFFLHNEGVFVGDANGNVNIGKTKFAYPVPLGYKSLYDYYNVNKNRLIVYDIESEVTIIPKIKMVSSYIFSDVVIDRTLPISYGLNRLYDTDNTISDTFDNYYEPDLDYLPNLSEIIRKDNNGYYNNKTKVKTLFSKFKPVPIYNIDIETYEKQYIVVECDGVEYTESFKVPENSILNVKVKIKDKYKDKYIPGAPMSNRIIVGEPMTIKAHAPNYKTFNVNIVQLPHQIITVYHIIGNKRFEHIDSFTVTSINSKIYAKITYVEDGYTAGTLNITDAIIEEDTTVTSTRPSMNRPKIHVYDTSNKQVIYINSEGINRNTLKTNELHFDVRYNSSLKIYVESQDKEHLAGKLYYKFSNNEYETRNYITGGAIVNITRDIYIYAEPERIFKCDIEVIPTEHIDIELSGYDNKTDLNKYKISRYGKLYIRAIAKDGYCLDYVEIIKKGKDE